ncbi:ZP domain-containing protein-like [Cynoglossus semilaevis]|nr:ZP domain-containing protein-like [Cynoglossus semilaevis]
MEFRVKAEATHATIVQVILRAPLTTTKRRNTGNEFDIKWTPQPEDLGHHFPICFVVEAVDGSRVYQSEMRCVLVDVRNTQVQSHVICHESSMTVIVEKASFPRLSEDHLQLSDPSNTLCSLQTHSNNTHIIGVVPLNACGTQIEEDDDYLLFKNELTTVDSYRDLITRKNLLEVKFYCQYPKRGNVTQSFLTHRKTISVWDRGFGRFTYQFEFYPDNQFNDMIDPNSYPLEYELGSRIYMQIQATSSINNTVLFVESCRAAPYDNPNYHPVYSLIDNGCLTDPTVVVYPSSGDQFRFSIEAFKFIGLHDQVYISCSLMMCEAGNNNTRCSRGCVDPTQTSHRRRRRETVIESASHFVSQGPLRLRRAAESSESTVIGNLNLNMVFIAGCLLAAVGMVCGVVLFKAKMSKIKYQPLPSHEH